MKGTSGVAALLAFGALVNAASPAFAAVPNDDPQLLRALRGDNGVARCDCVLRASWIDESYPQVVVDAGRYRRQPRAERRRFAQRALGVAEAVYARQWGTPDIYGEIFVVDRAGTTLDRYRR